MVTNKFKILIVFFVLIATQFIHADSVTIDILKKNVEQGYARDQHALAVAYRYVRVLNKTIRRQLNGTS